jgi:mycothiol synthase
LADTAANVIDERQLPAMYMVWPIDRLPEAPIVAAPAGYLARPCSQQDLGAVRALIDSDAPINDRTWECFVDRIVPSGAFLIFHSESAQPVATASALHNPRATRHYFPFGGEVGYVIVEPRHRGLGLGRAAVARAIGRLIEMGYRHIFVGVQGWRLAAVKCYLGLGFVPLIHDDALIPRWRRVCEQLAWACAESEWPRSLSRMTGKDV